MKPINEREFEVNFVQEIRGFRCIKALAKQALAKLKSFLEVQDSPDQLPLRLRRDARMDEVEIECTRIAMAPLIR